MEYYCKVCNQRMSENVYDYSMRHFGRALCMEHQRNTSRGEAKRFLCRLCKQRISETVYNYSMRHFGKALCINHQKNASRNKPNSPKVSTQHRIFHYCTDCNRVITIAVFEYSMKHFGIPLCRSCQPYTERRKKRRSSAPPKQELNEPARIELGGKYPKEKRYYNGY